MNNEEIQNTELDNTELDNWADAPKPVANDESDAVPAPDVVPVNEADTTTTTTTSVVPSTASDVAVGASIDRNPDENIEVDDNLNFIYTLRNGKTLKTSVAKPSLGISTQLADKEVRAANGDNNEQIIIINYYGVYQMIMEKLIKVVLVDQAPMHGATFEHFTNIGMTKAELDDYMGIINTFYLS